MNEKSLTPMQLASKINDEYAAFNRTAAEAMHHAIACGAYLIAAKEKVGHGEWKKWVEKHLNCSYANATKYMKAARHRDLLKKVASTQPFNGVEPALAYIRSQTATKEPEPATVDENGLNILDGANYPEPKPEPVDPRWEPVKNPPKKLEDEAVDANFYVPDPKSAPAPAQLSSVISAIDELKYVDDIIKVVQHAEEYLGEEDLVYMISIAMDWVSENTKVISQNGVKRIAENAIYELGGRENAKALLEEIIACATDSLNLLTGDTDEKTQQLRTPK